MKLFGNFLLILLLSSCLLPYAFTVSEAMEMPIETPYPDSQFMVIEDLYLHYRSVLPQVSNPEKKILFVHGLGGSTYSFNSMFDFLIEEGYAVVAVDLPGFGYSGRPTTFDHSQANRASVLWKFLDQFESSHPEIAKGPWHVVGHSMGGGAVSAMAVERPEDTASVTLIAGALENPENLLITAIHFPPYARWTQIFLERSLLTEKRVYEILTNAYGRVPTEDEILAYLEPLQLPGTARSLTQFTKTSQSLPLAALDSLNMPISAIWGEFDTIVPIQNTRAIGVHLPQMRLYIIPGAGHMPMETHPNESNAALIDFLSEQ